MYFRSPSEDIPRKQRIATTRSPDHKGRLREQGLVLPLVDFFHPTTHAGTANRVHASGSLRRHSPRARFGYLLRDSFTAPANTTSRVGASLGFTLQGFPLERDRSTFRWPCLLDVAAYTPLPPKGEGRHMAAFKASLPRRVRAAPRQTKHESRSASAVDPFLRFFPSRVLLPLDLAHAFYRRASPRTLCWGDVPVRLGLRVSRYKRVGHPVSGVPTLLGFVTLRICGAPSASLKGPDHRRSARSSGPVLLPSHLDPIFSKSNTTTEVAATAKQVDRVPLRRCIAAPTSPQGHYPSRSGVATDCHNQSVRAVVSRRPSQGGSALNVTQRQIPGLPPGATVPR